MNEGVSSQLFDIHLEGQPASLVFRDRLFDISQNFMGALGVAWKCWNSADDWNLNLCAFVVVGGFLMAVMHKLMVHLSSTEKMLLNVECLMQP